MKKARIPALLLALCLVLLCFAGCGDSSNSAEEESTSSAAEEAESASEEVEEPEDAEEYLTTPSGAQYNSDGYVLPLYDYDLTITYRASLNESELEAVGDYGTNPAVIAAEEATGVHVEWNVPATTTASETLQLAIAAGDYEDVMMDFVNNYTGSLSSAYENEIIIDLLPYLDDSMPFYKEALQNAKDDTKRDLIEDGRLLAVANITDYGDIATEGMMVRTDYLDAVGMDIPVTYDDLYDVMTAFKSELGIAQPIMLPKNLCPTNNSLCAGLDVYGCFTTEPFQTAPWYQVDGEIKFGIVEDGYHEFIEMLHQWYEEGLVSTDFVEKNDNPAGSTYLGVISSGDAGVFFGETDLMATYIADGEAENPDFEIACMPEIVREEGQITHFVNSASQLGDDQAVINAHCENIEAVLTWLDYFYTLDGAQYNELGVEGETYEIVDGKYQFTDAYLNADMTEKVKAACFMQDEVPRMGLDVPDTYQLEIQLTAEDIWITNDDGAWVLPSISLNSEETETYSRIFSDVSTCIAENLTKFVVGDKDLADWDDFIDEIYDIGLQECIHIYQEALDRYYTIDISVFS